MATKDLIAPGLPLGLAERRAEAISNVRYQVEFRIGERIEGTVTVRFDLEGEDTVVLDFDQPADHILAVSAPYEFTDGHITLAATREVRIEFVAGEGSIHRQDEFVYTLFVPDRASHALPCFDQPNLKARFKLSLEVPEGWVAIANGAVGARQGRRITFAETRPIPTYLFSFVAGKFEEIAAERNGRLFRMYHRETDRGKVERNASTIFDLHASALAWLEAYTQIPYPWGKFDFVLIPPFPYGGMEHPGAIFYRASTLLLDESATQEEKLARASVIAHETAHMWFGDLVTMNWFDDVWTKESFASFMADKIVRPSFPKLNHALRFFTAHHPAAYAIDRSRGTHPLHQELENLQEAGTLYGALIYRKSAVVLKQMELLAGEEAFRDGLGQYLKTYSFANATWVQLVEILDRQTDVDLEAFSRMWVYQSGWPTITTGLTLKDGKIEQLFLKQLGGVWNQRLDVLLGPSTSLPVTMDAADVEVAAARGLPAPDFVLPNGKGRGYGLFVLDERSLLYIKDNWAAIRDPLTRGVIWETLWDALLERWMQPQEFLALARQALATETVELNVQLILGKLGELSRRYLDPPAELEWQVWELIQAAASPTLKSTYFKAYRDLVRSPEGVEKMKRVWLRELKIPGLKFSEQDEMATALALGLRGRSKVLLDMQAARIQNPDRRKRFAFVHRAVEDPDGFFQSLRDVKNRRHEPWVLEGLALLHHPLRAKRSEKHILPSLELLEEIQRTGDIFFPMGWISTTLSGHRSRSAANTVESFLSARPHYPRRLRLKILQAADGLFRAAHYTSVPGR
ncbi:M1 family aminopeptidase [Acidobacteria bacterium AH-259-G07]|nr:M1 family aminopeptidase [Acidobacteria bacterium AH-259-G07]